MLAGKCLSNGKEPSDVKLSQPGKKVSFDFQSKWMQSVFANILQIEWELLLSKIIQM